MALSTWNVTGISSGATITDFWIFCIWLEKPIRSLQYIQKPLALLTDADLDWLALLHAPVIAECQICQICFMMSGFENKNTPFSFITLRFHKQYQNVSELFSCHCVRLLNHFVSIIQHVFPVVASRLRHHGTNQIDSTTWSTVDCRQIWSNTDVIWGTWELCTNCELEI